MSIETGEFHDEPIEHDHIVEEQGAAIDAAEDLQKRVELEQQSIKDANSEIEPKGGRGWAMNEDNTISRQLPPRD